MLLKYITNHDVRVLLVWEAIDVRKVLFCRMTSLAAMDEEDSVCEESCDRTYVDFPPVRRRGGSPYHDKLPSATFQIF